jgi:hypothetical protein
VDIELNETAVRFAAPFVVLGSLALAVVLGN